MTQADDQQREFVLSALVQYESRLVHYATRLLFGREDRARDVVQHVFLKLCEQTSSELSGRVGPWLFRVCRNRVTDELRRDGKLEQFGDEQLNRVDERQLNPGELAETEDVLCYIRSLIGDLPMAQQEVIELWSHGLKHGEIAEVMGKTSAAVRVGLHRAIESLKSDERIRQWLREQGLREQGLREQAGESLDPLPTFKPTTTQSS
jgi:RNA polymerase sigma-70 factor (ECF subfamily)